MSMEKRRNSDPSVTALTTQMCQAWKLAPLAYITASHTLMASNADSAAPTAPRFHPAKSNGTKYSGTMRISVPVIKSIQPTTRIDMPTIAVALAREAALELLPHSYN